LFLEGGVKKKILKTRRNDSTRLIPPDDDFIPIDQYKKEFGSPSRFGLSMTKIKPVLARWVAPGGTALPD
jgi:hypothetical protein